jgi:hypothetical protein
MFFYKLGKSEVETLVSLNAGYADKALKNICCVQLAQSFKKDQEPPED